MATRLIVNADGLGLTRGVNAGIVEAHRRGIVTSSTLVVSGSAAEEVPALSAANPRLAIGLHVQLTGGPSQLPATRVPSLVDKGGRFPPRVEDLVEADPAEVLAEARAQLARFRELMGRDPTHFDAHHHADRVPAVFAAVVAMARETARPVGATDPGMAALLHREGIATADRLEEGRFEGKAALDALLAILRSLPEVTSELVCHPAAIDDELRAPSTDAASRGRELEALTSEAVLAAVRESGIELVSYAEL